MDDDENVPADDARDFHIQDGQQRAKRMRETRLVMIGVANQINASLASYASRLSYI